MDWWVTSLWQTDPIKLLSWVIWVPLSIILHELGHGLAAMRQGDDTPARSGHMTWDPLVHMGGASLLVFALCGVAWGQMPVNPLRFRQRRLGEVIVAAAGPIVNIVIALVVLLILALWKQYGSDPATSNFSRNLGTFLHTGGLLNFALLILNLIPLPPLDGSVILSGLSSQARRFLSGPEVQQFALFAFIAIFFLGAEYIWGGANALVAGYCQFWEWVLPG